MTYLLAMLLFLALGEAPAAVSSRCVVPTCSCVAVGNSVAEARARSSAVFVGRVDSVERVTRAFGTNEMRRSVPLVRARLQVLAAWPRLLSDSLAAAHERETATTQANGAVVLAEPIVWVTTPAAGPSCGFHFKRGSEYLVYADGPTTGLWTGKCARTRPLWRARGDMARLGQPSIDRRRRARADPDVKR